MQDRTCASTSKAPTRRERRAQRRQAAAVLRARRAENRAAARARRQLATGAPQPVKTHLVARGIDTATARRFAGAFSRGTVPTATDTTVVKLKGRTRKTVPVKLYDESTFAARLAVYRPRDPQAAGRFDQLAGAVAA